MAKHMVICPHCNQRFDANEEEFVLKSRRYWHKECFEKAESEKTQEQRDEEALYAYCSQLFGKSFNFLATKRLIAKYKTESKFTYSGMLRTLKYWYEIKGNSTDKANGTVGIIPYAYNDAYNYWYSIWLANQNNKPTILKTYEPKVIEITIPEPVSKPNLRKPFKFLDLDEEVPNGDK